MICNRRRFRRFYLGSFFTVSAVCWVSLFLFWHRTSKSLPARPELHPLSRFVAYYAPAGSAEHSLFYFGLMGFGKKIENADIILFGTSHVIFGISAKEMTRELSLKYGRPVNVFNMGLVYGESAIFPAKILQRDNAKNKTVLLDVYTEFKDTSSPEANATERRDILSGAFRAGKIWSHYYSDWILDPLLPALRPEGVYEGTPWLHRCLGDTLFRTFEYGDNAGVWLATYGERYLTSDAHPLGTGDPFAERPNRFVDYSPQASKILGEMHEDTIGMLIPFEGSRFAVIPISPIIRIDPARLRYIDQHHVNAASRAEVTNQIIKWLENEDSTWRK